MLVTARFAVNIQVREAAFGSVSVGHTGFAWTSAHGGR